MSDKLKRYRQIWKEKKIIRDIYTDWYKKILKDLKVSNKRTLELGAGSGNFKEFKTETMASDIEYCEWLDICFDAHCMPFKKDTAGNIVMIDVLHHLADPIRFFHEAARVLETGGRLVLIEPFPTVFSLFIYKRFHPEPFLMNADYFNTDSNRLESQTTKDPWESNQAIAYLLFFKYMEKFLQLFKDKFKVIKRKRNSCFLYPASGGFENKALIPDALVPLFKLLEILLAPIRWLLAFRCYVVLEKNKK